MVDMPCRSFRPDDKGQNRQRDRPTRRCTNRCEPLPDLLEHRVELQRPGRVRKPHLGSRSKDGPWGSLDQLTRARRWLLGERRGHRQGSPRRPGFLAVPLCKSLRRPALRPRLDVRLWKRSRHPGCAHQPVPGGPGVLPAGSQLAGNVWRPSRVAPPDVVTIYNGADDRLLRLRPMIRRDDQPYVYAPPPRGRTTAHAALRRLGQRRVLAPRSAGHCVLGTDQAVGSAVLDCRAVLGWWASGVYSPELRAKCGFAA